MSQPPLPPCVLKLPLPTGPPKPQPPQQSLIPPLPPQVTSPLKMAAVNSRMTQSKHALAYSTNLQKEDTTTRRRQADWDRAKNSTVGLPKRRASLSYTSTPSPSDEDHDDLRGKVNELHDNRKNQQNQLVHRRTRRFVKVVSQGEAMPYKNRHDEMVTTKSKGPWPTWTASDAEPTKTEAPSGNQDQWTKIEVDPKATKVTKAVMRYRSRTKSDP